MYYITGASNDLELLEITDCLTRKTSVITGKQFDGRDDVIGKRQQGKFYSCTEVPDEGELDLLLEEYTNGIKHEEDGRYFLFIPVSEVKTITKPIYVVTRYKGDGHGPWKLYMLKKTDRGATRIPEQAYQTEDKGEAIRKANSINDYYTKQKWPPADYRVRTLTETIALMQKDDQISRY